MTTPVWSNELCLVIGDLDPANQTFKKRVSEPLLNIKDETEKPKYIVVAEDATPDAYLFTCLYLFPNAIVKLFREPEPKTGGGTASVLPDSPDKKQIDGQKAGSLLKNTELLSYFFEIDDRDFLRYAKDVVQVFKLLQMKRDTHVQIKAILDEIDKQIRQSSFKDGIMNDLLMHYLYKRIMATQNAKNLFMRANVLGHLTYDDAVKAIDTYVKFISNQLGNIEKYTALKVEIIGANDQERKTKLDTFYTDYLSDYGVPHIRDYLEEYISVKDIDYESLTVASEPLIKLFKELIKGAQGITEEEYKNEYKIFATLINKIESIKTSDLTINDQKGGAGATGFKKLFDQIAKKAGNILTTDDDVKLKMLKNVFASSDQIINDLYSILKTNAAFQTPKSKITDHIDDVLDAFPKLSSLIGGKEGNKYNVVSDSVIKIDEILIRYGEVFPQPPAPTIKEIEPATAASAPPLSATEITEQRAAQIKANEQQAEKKLSEPSALERRQNAAAQKRVDENRTAPVGFQSPPPTEEEKLLSTIKNIKEILGPTNPLTNQLTTALINKQAPSTSTTVYPVQTPTGTAYTAITGPTPVQPNPFAVTATSAAPTVASTQQQNKSAGVFSAKKLAEDRYESVIKSMVEYELFVDAMRKKEVAWTIAVNNKAHLEDLERQKVAANKDDKASSKKRAYINSMSIIRKTASMLLSRAEKAYDDIKTFHIKTNRSDVKNIITYLRDENIRIQKIQDATERTKAQERPKKVYDQFNDLQGKLKKETDNYFTNILSKLDQLQSDFQLKVAVMQHSIEEKNQSVVKDLDAMRERVTLLRNKILSIYNLNYSMTDILFDHQFMIMYIIKGIRILFMYVALFLSTRIFVPMYEVAVYDSKTTPPSLWKYLLIFLGFDLAFNAFLVVTLYLLMFIFSSPDNTFPINKYLFMKYLADYVMSMALLLVISYIASTVIVSKKYFKYKYEGARAIRAFESLIFKVGIVVVLLPFFWVAA